MDLRCIVYCVIVSAIVRKLRRPQNLKIGVLSLIPASGVCHPPTTKADSSYCFHFAKILYIDMWEWESWNIIDFIFWALNLMYCRYPVTKENDANMVKNHPNRLPLFQKFRHQHQFQTNRRPRPGARRVNNPQRVTWSQHLANSPAPWNPGCNAGRPELIEKLISILAYWSQPDPPQPTSASTLACFFPMNQSSGFEREEL